MQIVRDRENNTMHRNGRSPAAKFGSRLGHARRGFRGFIHSIDVDTDHGGHGGLANAEIESRLIELGFVEGASVEILHEGAFGRDPIAVRVNDATVALRRREAMAIFVG